jgi:HAD superfamily hydrolase (TIGR01490 family)
MAEPRIAKQQDAGAAFFDMDRTLIEVNSGLLYALYERREGRLGRWQLVRSGFWTLLYHLSLIDMERAYARALAHYRGTPEALVVERTRAWFAAEVASRLLPGARAALDEHRERGHPRILLTNSSSYAAREATAAWALDGWLANSFELDLGGCLTGLYERPLCYGQGKVVRALSWAEERGVRLEHSYFYTDSFSDRQMLEAVGYPRVVNPDPRLKRLARQRGWPVLDWRATRA